MRISPYQNGIVQYNFKPFQTNIELETKVLMYKQNQFDEAYKGLQNLKKQALNIQFLNKQNQSVIDNFNKNVSKSFSSLDTGNFDLSKVDIVNKYTKQFSELINTPNILSNYRQDKKVQQELQSVRKMQNSKDPLKSGFSNSNYENFQRRLNNYINDTSSDLSNAASKVKYSKYVDIDTKVNNKVKFIPLRKFQTSNPTNGGLMQIDNYVGKDKTGVNKAVTGYFKGEGGTQLAEDAENYYYKNKDRAGFKQEIQGQYHNTLQNNIDQIDSRIDLLNKESKATTTTSERLLTVSQNLASLNEQRSNLITQQNTATDPSNFNDENMLGWVTQLYTMEAVTAYTESLGGYSKSTRFEIDPAQTLALKIGAQKSLTSYRNAQLGLQAEKAQVDVDYKNEMLKIQEKKLNQNAKKLGLNFIEAGYNPDGTPITSSGTSNNGVQSALNSAVPNVNVQSSRYAKIPTGNFANIVDFRNDIAIGMARETKKAAFLKDFNPLKSGIPANIRSSDKEIKAAQTHQSKIKYYRDRINEINNFNVDKYLTERDKKLNPLTAYSGGRKKERTEEELKILRQKVKDGYVIVPTGLVSYKWEKKEKALADINTDLQNLGLGPTLGQSFSQDDILEIAASDKQFNQRSNEESFIFSNPYILEYRDQLNKFLNKHASRQGYTTYENIPGRGFSGDLNDLGKSSVIQVDKDYKGESRLLQGRKEILNYVAEVATHTLDNDPYNSKHYEAKLKGERRYSVYERKGLLNPGEEAEAMIETLADDMSTARFYTPVHFDLRKQDGETNENKAEREKYASILVETLRDNIKGSGDINKFTVDASMIKEVFDSPSGRMRYILNTDKLPKGVDENGNPVEKQSWTFNIVNPNSSKGKEDNKKITITRNEPFFEIMDRSRPNKTDMYFLLDPPKNEWHTFAQDSHIFKRYYDLKESTDGSLSFRVHEEKENTASFNKGYLFDPGNVMTITNGNLIIYGEDGDERAINPNTGEPYKEIPLGRNVNMTELMQQLDKCYIRKDCADRGIFSNM